MTEPLTQQQQALLERYTRARAAWKMAVNDDDTATGAAYVAALDACVAAGVDPFHYPQP
jgi:hypothetical protein